MNERARKNTASSPSPNACSWNQAEIIKPRIGLPRRSTPATSGAESTCVRQTFTGRFWRREGTSWYVWVMLQRVRFGIKTGANDFFFLNKEDLSAWNIEDEFLVPAMKNVREADRIVVKSSFFPTSPVSLSSFTRRTHGDGCLRICQVGGITGLSLTIKLQGASSLVVSRKATVCTHKL